MADNYKETRILPKFTIKKKDPFWDPPSLLLRMGTSYLHRKNKAKSRKDDVVKNTAELHAEVSAEEIDLQFEK